MDIIQHIICCTSRFYMFNSMNEICVAKNCWTSFMYEHIGRKDTLLKEWYLWVLGKVVYVRGHREDTNQLAGFANQCVHKTKCLLAKFEKEKYSAKSNKMQIKTAQNKVIKLAK